MVNLDAAFGEQLLDVPVGQPEERRYQRTASVMTSGGKRNPAKSHRERLRPDVLISPLQVC